MTYFSVCFSTAVAALLSERFLRSAATSWAPCASSSRAGPSSRLVESGASEPGTSLADKEIAHEARFQLLRGTGEQEAECPYRALGGEHRVVDPEHAGLVSQGHVLRELELPQRRGGIAQRAQARNFGQRSAPVAVRHLGLKAQVELRSTPAGSASVLPHARSPRDREWLRRARRGMASFRAAFSAN